MYNLIEYSDNNSDISVSLWQLKGDEQNMDNGNPENVTTAESTSFEYKSSILGNPAAYGVLKNLKIVVPLRYLSSFWRSLEIPLINCKVHLVLNWTKSCVMYNIAGATTFKITSTKLYAPIVTLSTKDNVNLTKQLNTGFKRPVYWNEYKTKIESKDLDNNNRTRFYLDASFQEVKRLFVLAFDDIDNIDNGANKVERKSHRKCFLPRVNITNYNVLIDGRNFCKQPINYLIK